MTAESYVIVGAGLAGAKAAESLRSAGFTGSITMIGDEPHAPYERPGLSKGYLAGRTDKEELFVHPGDWYAANDVALLTGVAATEIDRGGHEVVLADGRRIGYDKLLIATGSSPRHLDVPGADLQGVHYLRTISDSERIRDGLRTGGKVVVVGAGWIGLETAAAARAAGLEVTLLEVADLPLVRVLGPEVAQVFADLHTEQGVRAVFGAKVAELVGDDGHVVGVRLDDGTVVDADLVLVGVGITPNTQLAQAAGLEVDNGIVVDEHLRTSDPDIFAVGDVANAFHPGLDRRIRVEHWANALNQPAVAATSMRGEDAVYDRLPYFYSDQYDMGMEYTGYVEPGGYDRVVFRGDPAGGEYIVFWVGDGRVLAGMNVNVWDVTDDIKALIGAGRGVDLDALADPATPLSALLP
jgi:3-phenylpropionate/trans-cinnamate dioxygenase ferredoxin reductase subunit